MHKTAIFARGTSAYFLNYFFHKTIIFLIHHPPFFFEDFNDTIEALMKSMFLAEKILMIKKYESLYTCIKWIQLLFLQFVLLTMGKLLLHLWSLLSSVVPDLKKNYLYNDSTRQYKLYFICNIKKWILNFIQTACL